MTLSLLVKVYQKEGGRERKSCVRRTEDGEVSVVSRSTTEAYYVSERGAYGYGEMPCTVDYGQ